jgi:hypothetical protein
VGYEHA